MSRRSWAELGSVALVIAALSVAVFWPALDPSQRDVAGRYDVYRQFGPWNYFFDHALQSGDFPEWNPLVFSGAPHSANPQSWALYPPNVLRALLHRQPTPLGTLRGLGALMGLHLLLWSLGTYQLARAHGLARDSALLSAIVASFSALMVRRIAEFHFIFTLAWLPWMLLCIKGVVDSQRRTGDSWRSGVGFALALALLFAHAVLGGFLQIVPHLVIALAAYAGAELLLSYRLEPRRSQYGLRVLALTAIAGVLAIGLAAMLLVPASELLAHSPRASGSGVNVGGHKPEAWNLVYAAKSLLVFPGRIFEPETLRGAGIIALALALASLAQWPLRQAAPFLAMLYALLDLMLGRPWPLSSLLSTVSPVQLVSGTRAFDVAMLPFSILAGLGLENLRRARFGGASVALLVASSGVVVLYRQIAEGDVWLKPDVSVWVIPLVFVGVLLLWLLRPQGRALWAPLTLLLLVGELLAWNRLYAPGLLVRHGFDADWKARDGFTGTEPFWPHNYRETTDRENFSLFSLRGISNGYDPLHLRSYREAVAGRRNLRYRRTLRERETVTDTPRGHLFLKRAFWLVPRVVTGPMPLTKQMFAPTQVAFVTTLVPAGFPVASDEDALARGDANTRIRPLTFHRRSSREFLTESVTLTPAHHLLLARFFVSHDEEIEVAVQFTEEGGKRTVPGYKQKVDARAGQPLDLVFPVPDMRELTIGIVSNRSMQDSELGLDSLALQEDLADEQQLISVQSRSADRVDVRVSDLAAPRLLAFIDVDYPGWRAFVDGRPVAYARVNDTFKGVWLGPGSHRVRFEFASPTLRIGLWISALSLLACGALFLVARRWR